MRFLIILIVCLFLSQCTDIASTDVCVVKSKLYIDKERCNYTIGIPLALDVFLICYPCDQFDIGDTVDFLPLRK